MSRFHKKEIIRVGAILNINIVLGTDSAVLIRFPTVICAEIPAHLISEVCCSFRRGTAKTR